MWPGPAPLIDDTDTEFTSSPRSLDTGVIISCHNDGYHHGDHLSQGDQGTSFGHHREDSKQLLPIKI